jgi:hypothetical protein
MPILLVAAALWATFLLLVLALCLAARQGDRQQPLDPEQPSCERYLLLTATSERAPVRPMHPTREPHPVGQPNPT